jgi:hypothetical protein
MLESWLEASGPETVGAEYIVKSMHNAEWMEFGVRCELKLCDIAHVVEQRLTRARRTCWNSFTQCIAYHFFIIFHHVQVIETKLSLPENVAGTLLGSSPDHVGSAFRSDITQPDKT